MRKKEWMTSSNVLMVTEYLLQLDISTFSTLHTEREPEWKERVFLLTQAYQRVKKINGVFPRGLSVIPLPPMSND